MIPERRKTNKVFCVESPSRFWQTEMKRAQTKHIWNALKTQRSEFREPGQMDLWTKYQREEKYVETKLEKSTQGTFDFAIEY